MAKEIDKIIQSKTAPKSNNVLWDDGENLKIYRNGKWESTNNNEAFIPNTVIKTTPQELSDTNKNQALANLGIADLLEALKPVQLSDAPPVGTVTQEQLDEIGLTKKVIGNICDGYTRTINIYNANYAVINSYKDDNINYHFIIAKCDFGADGTIAGLTQFYILCVNGVYDISTSEI